MMEILFMLFSISITLGRPSILFIILGQDQFSLETHTSLGGVTTAVMTMLTPPPPSALISVLLYLAVAVLLTCTIILGSVNQIYKNNGR